MCMVDYSDNDWTPLTSRLIRTARKPHQCGECNRRIEPGEKYVYDTAVGDGRIYRERTCLHCKAAQDWLNEKCNGFLFGGVLDDLDEHIDSNEADLRCLRIIVGMKRQWMRFDGAGLMKPLAA